MGPDSKEENVVHDRVTENEEGRFGDWKWNASSGKEAKQD
jgi:hypothetical protein